MKKSGKFVGRTSDDSEGIFPVRRRQFIGAALGYCAITPPLFSSRVGEGRNALSSFSAVDEAQSASNLTIADLTGGFTPKYELGVPTAATTAHMFDQLAYQRAIQIYLAGLAPVGMQQYRVANAEAMGGGSDDYKLGYLGELMKSNILHLTGNPDSMYIDYFFDTHKGPIVMEVPATLPGFIDDMWELPVIDVIQPVSPKGFYLIVPPDWKGTAPPDHKVVQPKTYSSWMLLRGNVELKDGKPDTTAAVNEMKTKLKIYPLSALDKPQEQPKLQYFDMSDKKINRIPPEGFEFFERLAEVVTHETTEQTDAFTMGLLKCIGMEPGRQFEPDARMKVILSAAAETGQAMARSIAFYGLQDVRWHWQNRKYSEAFIGGSASFIKDGRVNHDARILFFYLACGTSQLMNSTEAGKGQAYPWVVSDGQGKTLDGGRTYKMHIPANIPAALYWSVTCYDTGTRSYIENGTPFSKVSTFTKPEKNPDGSYDLYFGPEAPKGKAQNWVKTVPNRGWFFLFRLYGPTKEYFDKSWVPDDLVEVSS